MEDTKPNSVFTAYLDVRSNKSDINLLLLDYKACSGLFAPSMQPRVAMAAHSPLRQSRTTAPMSWFSPEKVLAAWMS